MSWAIDLEAQQIFKLNEHLLVANRIRKAGRSACQGNDWLRNKLLNPSGDDNLAPSLPISLEGNALTMWSVDRKYKTTVSFDPGHVFPHWKTRP
jgi:hypothetical protein